jgi:hypothetical protein
VPTGYVPLDSYRRAAVITLALVMLLAAAGVVSSWLEIQLFDEAIGGDPITQSEADANDTRQGVIAIIQLATLLVCVVFFIRWLHRAYKNLDYLGPGNRRFDTGWAIGAWFVPFLNLVRPLRIVNDVWRAAARREPTPLVAVWWTVWIVSNVLDSIASRSNSDADLRGLRGDSIELLISDVGALVAGVLAILVVQTHTRAMETRAAELASGAADRFRAPLAPGDRVGGWTPPTAATAAEAPALQEDEGSRPAARAASVPRRPR